MRLQQALGGPQCLESLATLGEKQGAVQSWHGGHVALSPFSKTPGSCSLITPQYLYVFFSLSQQDLSQSCAPVNTVQKEPCGACKLSSWLTGPIPSIRARLEFAAGASRRQPHYRHSRVVERTLTSNAPGHHASSSQSSSSTSEEVSESYSESEHQFGPACSSGHPWHSFEPQVGEQQSGVSCVIAAAMTVSSENEKEKVCVGGLLQSDPQERAKTTTASSGCRPPTAPDPGVAHGNSQEQATIGLTNAGEATGTPHRSTRAQARNIEVR